MFEKVAAMLAEYLGVNVEEITRESDIKKDLKADSLVLVELLFNLEDETGITVEDEAAKSLATVGDVVDYIEKRLGK
ncbi:MAG: acyl carrier protein [Christensenellales bacterium]|jgi:acyl carrier protein